MLIEINPITPQLRLIRRIVDILKKEKASLELLANTLLEKEVLDVKEIKALLKFD